MNDKGYQTMEQPAAQPKDDGVIDPFAPEHPINQQPCVRYCRNCGARVEPGASVCINCNYVLDVATLQRAQHMVRVRHEQARRQAQRNRGLIGLVSDVLTKVLVGEQGAQNPQAPAVPRQRYMYHTEGACYCSGCGQEVEEGAVVCVHCGYVINPAAVAHAQMVLSDRKAKLTLKDILKSLLVPGFGRNYFQIYETRRPKLAKIYKRLGIVNKLLIAGAIIGSFILISNL